MKQSCVALWSLFETRRWLLLTGIMAFVAAAGPALAEDERPAGSQAVVEELEQEVARMDEQMKERAAINEKQGVVPKVGGPITCGDDYCTGLYEDLVEYRWEKEDGYSGIRVTAAVESYLAASSQNCLWDWGLLFKEGGDTSASKNATMSRWLGDMTLAQVLGYEIQLTWIQSNYSWGAVCILDRLWVLTPQ